MGFKMLHIALNRYYISKHNSNHLILKSKNSFSFREDLENFKSLDFFRSIKNLV